MNNVFNCIRIAENISRKKFSNNLKYSEQEEITNFFLTFGYNGILKELNETDELKGALESYDKLYKYKFEITLLNFLFYENCVMIIEFKNYDKIIDSIKKYNEQELVIFLDFFFMIFIGSLNNLKNINHKNTLIEKVLIPILKLNIDFNLNKLYQSSNDGKFYPIYYYLIRLNNEKLYNKINKIGFNKDIFINDNRKYCYMKSVFLNKDICKGSFLYHFLNIEKDVFIKKINNDIISERKNFINAIPFNVNVFNIFKKVFDKDTYNKILIDYFTYNENLKHIDYKNIINYKQNIYDYILLLTNSLVIDRIFNSHDRQSYNNSSLLINLMQYILNDTKYILKHKEKKILVNKLINSYKVFIAKNSSNYDYQECLGFSLYYLKNLKIFLIYYDYKERRFNLTKDEYDDCILNLLNLYYLLYEKFYTKEEFIIKNLDVNKKDETCTLILEQNEVVNKSLNGLIDNEVHIIKSITQYLIYFSLIYKVNVPLNLNNYFIKYSDLIFKNKNITNEIFINDFYDIVSFLMEQNDVVKRADITIYMCYFVCLMSSIFNVDDYVKFSESFFNNVKNKNDILVDILKTIFLLNNSNKNLNNLINNKITVLIICFLKKYNEEDILNNKDEIIKIKEMKNIISLGETLTLLKNECNTLLLNNDKNIDLNAVLKLEKLLIPKSKHNEKVKI